jgi:hypothetical protein
VSYTPGDSTFGADVTVQNLIPQPLGTTNVAVDSAGVRVFFAAGPTVTSGSGSAVISNPSGRAIFTAPDQPFFQYDEVLHTNDISQAKRWLFHVDPTVASFSFVVYVAAAVPRPYGWIDITVPCPESDPIYLSAAARTVVGNLIPNAAVTWSSSDTTLATVTQNGVVTWHGGEVYIRATSGPRSGAVQFDNPFYCSDGLP